MDFNITLIDELNLLHKFPDSLMEGLKIHQNAEPEVIAAAQRLYDKGLISEPDGGYLTERGLEAADTATLLLGLLTNH